MAPPPSAPPPVRITGYEGFSEIGRGGGSVVYAAVQLPLRREVAVKVLRADLSDDVARRRFERECRAIVALGDAPGIVPVHGAAFTDDGRGCIVMARMRESLADVVRRDGPLPAERVARIGVVAATALAHAHRRGVAHRDVSPANLLVSPSGEVALADFGIAVVEGLGSGTTTAGSLSPPHAPPERLRGESGDGPAGDVWSLGSTLFTLLAGHPPFGSVTSEGGMAGLVERVLHEPTPSLGRAGVPDALDAAIARALEKDPGRRWPSAAAFADALATAVPSNGPAGAPSAPGEGGQSPAEAPRVPDVRSVLGRPHDERRRGTTLVVVGAAIAAAAAAAIIGLR